MKALLKRLAGADRPRVIAVVAQTRAAAEACIAHAHTAQTPLPVWVWCAEGGEPLPDCDRWFPSRQLNSFGAIWPALSIVAWWGDGFALAKLRPMLSPPFRVVVCNEAFGFFRATQASVAGHLWRRLRDASRSAAIRCGEWTRSLAYRSAERIRDAAVLLWNLVLAFAAFCAPVLAVFSRHLVRNGGAHPAGPLVLAATDSQGFTPIRVSARAWRRRSFVRALNRSSEPFVVIHRGAFDPRDCDMLLSVAAKQNAFACVLQEAYTGWRAQVLPKHPFRALQAGEMAEVLAPHSPLIVMRREALLHLDIPRAFTNGAAFMQICWRAAAHGLVSLAVGSGQPLPQEPAMHLEDFEFALRRRFGALRGLSPSTSDVKRGNIATAMRPAPPCLRPLNVLIVSPYLPFPLSHGGAVRIYNLCRALSTDISFTLACFREADEHVDYEALHRVFDRVYAVDIDEKHADRNVPAQIAGYRNSAMAALIESLCQGSGRPDIVQLEYTQMAEYRAHTAGVPVILVEHDITFSLYRQLAAEAKTEAALAEANRWVAFESEALRNADAVWTMSGDDREAAIEAGAHPSQVSVVPNGVDLDRYHPASRPAGSPSVLFIGSFRHLPNLLAFELLKDAIMPAVWQSVPEARLHVIAGPDHAKAAALASKSRLLSRHPLVSIEGFVEDVRDAYSRCDAVAVPLPVSAGTNIKVMEAMACGRAVVSTSLGCHGLGLKDGENVLIRDDPKAFAQALIELLTQPEARRRIAGNGRLEVERRFGWDAIANQARQSYAQWAAPVHAGCETQKVNDKRAPQTRASAARR